MADFLPLLTAVRDRLATDPVLATLRGTVRQPSSAQSGWYDVDLESLSGAQDSGTDTGSISLSIVVQIRSVEPDTLALAERARLALSGWSPPGATIVYARTDCGVVDEAGVRRPGAAELRIDSWIFDPLADALPPT